MKKKLVVALLVAFTSASFAQSGHLMQGVGAVNMSMGGAATAQPLDINGAIHWNPATIATFDKKTLSFSIGAFYASPELSSSVPADMMWPGSPAVSGTIEDQHKASMMPAIGFVYGKPDSKHTFAASAFGVSGFGVDFPEETNSPLAGASFDPSQSSSPISYPQNAKGFGHITSDYMMLQVSFSYAYQFNDKISFGIQPNINFESLQLSPNPTTRPDMPPPNGTGKLYPVTNKASAVGYGAQFGVFYDSQKMLKLGLSYKTKQSFSEYTFKNTYLDGTAAPDNTFTMNYPSILSLGLGLSGKKIDFAADIRFVNYENTEGFKESGWQINDDATSPAFGYPTGAVNGFGWNNITIVSLGLQYKVKENLPLRIGYTYNSNPIKDELTFFSVSAPAVITNAFQIGGGYTFGNLEVNVLYHMGMKNDENKGPLLSPQAYNPTTNPLGALPGTTVSYSMKTSLAQVTFSYKW